MKKYQYLVNITVLRKEEGKIIARAKGKTFYIMSTTTQEHTLFTQGSRKWKVIIGDLKQALTPLHYEATIIEIIGSTE